MKKIKSNISENYWRQGIKKQEYLLAILKGQGMILLISYLFYHSLILGCCLFPIAFLYLKQWEKYRIVQLKSNFARQFQEALKAMSAALRAGYSMENAMHEMVKDLSLIYSRNVRIMQELTQMNRQLAMNVPIEDIWREFSDRVNQEDVQAFTIVFIVAKRSGGDTIRILRETILQIDEKLEVKQEIAILISQKQMEFKIMSVIPLAMIAYMTISFFEFMSVLYRNAIGISIMTICLGLYCGAYKMGKSIIDIEV